MTAAGDQMARLWDVKSGELLGSFKGHLCSLKSVSFTPQEKGIFYTDHILYCRGHFCSLVSQNYCVGGVILDFGAIY